MTVQEAYQLRTLGIYRDATDRFPGAATWEFVHETIRQHRLTAESIRPIFSEWVARGYNPDNIQGILNVVVHGWREWERPRADPADRANPPDPYRARDEHDRGVIARLAESMR